MKFDITLEGIDLVISELGLAPKTARRLVNKIIARKVTTLRKEVVSDIYEAYQIPRTSAKIQKIRSRKRSRVGRGTIWIGRNSIKSAYLGKLRKSGKGAYAGAHFFKGGFIRTMKSGHKGVFVIKDGKMVEEELELTKTPVMIRQRVLATENDINNNVATDLLQELEWLTS